ncbi:hypothetical protein AOLI_G00009960 [Acnodon oligacanthus]
MSSAWTHTVRVGRPIRRRAGGGGRRRKRKREGLHILHKVIQDSSRVNMWERCETPTVAVLRGRFMWLCSLQSRVVVSGFPPIYSSGNYRLVWDVGKHPSGGQLQPRPVRQACHPLSSARLTAAGQQMLMQHDSA